MLDHSNLFALLIDGDNLQVSFVPQILDKIHEYGNPIIKNVYLNRNSLTSEWDELINEHTIQPIYVPNNTPRKNAVDIAITIDAMELLFERKDLSGFCIISSDSDFTRLADYIVRKSRFVLGMGEDKTPTSFQKACSEFIEINDLTQTKNSVKLSQNTTVPAKTTPYDTDFGIVFARAYEKLTNGAHSWVQLMDLKEEMNALDDNLQSSEYRNTRRFAEKILATVH